MHNIPQNKNDALRRHSLVDTSNPIYLIGQIATLR